MSDRVRFLLAENELPNAWYDIQADLPRRLPPVLHPATLAPIGPGDRAPLFPMEIIRQEVSQERVIEIPEPVREIDKQWRPSPLVRARRREHFAGRLADQMYDEDEMAMALAGLPAVVEGGQS